MSAEQHTYTNSLIHQTSPYLLQHAHNPVNWNAWTGEIWEKAENENRLVIVSIGYSTCHWCHVMEKECFENAEVAGQMNDHFISIKVDREEMPDVDQVYMDACQLMTGRGGWPLNVVCTPDKKPVFAGTYFPKEHWTDVLKQLSVLWETDPAKVIEYAGKMENGLRQLNLVEFPRKDKFTVSGLQEVYNKLTNDFDIQRGGLKRSQKFPLPSVYEYLLDEYLCGHNTEALEFANFTLLKMANGGIHDHIRGGFYRYATDPEWFAPHFEKMLYDNAQLLSLYSRAFSVTGAEVYKQVADGIVAFVERELRNPEGGYFSALDADSEGAEGKFYVFSWQELQQILSEDELTLAAEIYNLKPEGNWENGLNILHKTLSPAEILHSTGLTAAGFNVKIDNIRNKLLIAQDKRIRPGTDTKVICSWNALYLSGITEAAAAFRNQDYLQISLNLAEYIRKTFRKDGTLCRIMSDNGNQLPAVAEDYANTIHALIELHKLQPDATWLHFAEELANVVVSDFFDHEKMLFQSRSRQQPRLLVDKTDISDDVIVSANSSLSIDLQRLGILLNRTDLINTGEQMLDPVRSQIAEHPAWYSNWARAAQAEALGMIQVINTMPEKLNNLLTQIPAWVVASQHSDNPSPAVLSKSGSKKGIYLCAGKTCFEPVLSEEQALEILGDILPGNHQP